MLYNRIANSVGVPFNVNVDDKITNCIGQGNPMPSPGNQPPFGGTPYNLSTSTLGNQPPFGSAPSINKSFW